MFEMILAALIAGSSIGLGNAAVPAPATAEMASFGIRGFTGESQPVAAPQPVAAQQLASNTEERESTRAVSRDVERPPAPVVEQNNVQEAPAAVEASPTREIKEKPVQANPAPATGVLGIAAQYTYVPYVYGGTTTAGFDCSGYTSFVFRQVGINLPRSAAQQQSFATPVSNPQPGDLVFWGAPAWHVAIYAGNGMIYDAGNPAAGISYRSMFSGVTRYGRVG